MATRGASRTPPLTGVRSRPTFQQPYNAVPDGNAMAHRGRCALLAGCTNQTGPNYTRRTNSDRSHPLGSIRPRYEKDEKAKKGWRGGFCAFLGFFVPGPCLATLPQNVENAARHSHRAANAILLPNAKTRIVSGDTPLAGRRTSASRRGLRLRLGGGRSGGLWRRGRGSVGRPRPRFRGGLRGMRPRFRAR